MSPAPRKISKGEETRAQILEAALEVASQTGFDALTIGSLAERTGLSKSGLFAHFGSKEELQIAVLDEAARRFTEIAFLAALKAPRGLARLRTIYTNWMGWSEKSNLPGGCPIMAAAFEYDDRPGPVRDAVVQLYQKLLIELERAIQMAIETGELDRQTDAKQLAFEMLGIGNALYLTHRLLKDRQAIRRANTAFERLIGCSLASSTTNKRRTA